MKTKSYYPNTGNTGSASGRVVCSGMPEETAAAIRANAYYRQELPTAPDGARVAFFGSDCVGEGRAWHEAWEHVAGEWTSRDDLSRVGARAWASADPGAVVNEGGEVTK